MAEFRREKEPMARLGCSWTIIEKDHAPTSAFQASSGRHFADLATCHESESGSAANKIPTLPSRFVCDLSKFCNFAVTTSSLPSPLK